MKSKNRIILASVLGNALELYDFSLYGIFAPLFATLFFPAYNSTTALLASLMTFAVGFFMRPLGGILFGHLGDRFGRKNALSLSITLMALPTLIIGFLPTYDQIGLLAPFILLLCRLLQGLCAGGEYNGASIFIIEHLGKSRSGLAGSLISASGAIGSLIAMMLGATLLHSSLPSWSWRIPFLLGAFLAFIGFYMRKRLQESPEFSELLSKKSTQHSSTDIPLLMAFRNYPLSIFRAFAVGAFANVLANTLVVYLNVYLTKVVGISIAHSMFFNSVGLFVVIFMIPFMGWLSDKVGQSILMRIGSILVMSSIYPLFLLLNSGINTKIIAVQISLAILMSLFLGPSNAFMNRLFPASTRYSGIAFGYCSGMAVMGGTMPAISTYLIAITGDIMAPAYYLMVCGFIGFLAVYKIKDTPFRREALPQ